MILRIALIILAIAPTNTHAFQHPKAHILNRVQCLASSTKIPAADGEGDMDGSQQQPAAAVAEAAENIPPAKRIPSKRKINEPVPQLSARDALTALGTSPRRLFLGASSATGIALAGNFLGGTSSLLSKFSPEVVESTGLDSYYPVKGFKRFTSAEFGYTLTVPQEWVADTSVELAKATRRAAALDYKMSRRGGGGGGVIPDAAFGPPSKFVDSRGVSSNTDTNVSVVVSPARRGFTLRSLGTPTEAAEFLLRVNLTPEGSGRKGTLIDARERAGKIPGTNAYQFEYEVDRGEKGVPLRAISIFSLRENDILLTMTVVAPKADWEEDGSVRFNRVIDSFRMTR